VWCFTGLIFLQGCGGGSDDSSADTQPTVQAAPPLANITCTKAGQIWNCNQEGTCFRDQNQEEEIVEVVEMDQPQLDTYPENDGIGAGGGGQQLRQYLIKSVGGDITIVAECGSNVSFNMVTGE